METFQSQLTRKLSEALSSAGFPLGGEVSPATDPRFGDYQSNAALVLGKQRGENPRKIAEPIIANLDITDVSEQPSVAGAGFINFTLKREAVETKIAALLRDKRLGVSTISSPKKIVIDFGSPGLWELKNETTWKQINVNTAGAFTTGDIDGGGKDDVIVNFAGAGVWAYKNDSSWAPINPAAPTN